MIIIVVRPAKPEPIDLEDVKEVTLAILPSEELPFYTNLADNINACG